MSSAARREPTAPLVTQGAGLPLSDQPSADAGEPASPTSSLIAEGAGLPPLTGGCRHPGGLPLTERALELAGLASGARVLDLGCGEGVTAEHLERRFGLRVAGIDVSASLLREGRLRRPELDLREGVAERLPFADAVFDAVLAECVLSVVADPGTAVDECARVLRPGGRLVVSDLYRRADPHAAHSLLADRGFDVVVWEDRSGDLARLVWDLAGPVPVAGFADREPAAGHVGREPAAAFAGIGGGGLGYFLCVARRVARVAERSG